MTHPIIRMLVTGLGVAAAMAAIGTWHRAQEVTASAAPAATRAVPVNWNVDSNRPLMHAAGSIP